MKLGILCTMINGFGRRGFYNSQEIGLGRALVRLGHAVNIYKALKRGPDLKLEKQDVEPGLTITYIPVGGVGAHGYFPISVLSPELEGILCFSDNQIFLPHVEAWCRKRGIAFVPYVGTTHSLYGGLHGSVMDAWFALGTLRLYRRLKVICKTEDARQELAKLGVTNSCLAPVGLDTAPLKQDYQNTDRAALRREFGLSPEDVVLGNVSRLENEKRPLDLIALLSGVRERKPFQLLLVGEGPLLEQVRQKIKDEGLEDCVKLVPRVPYQEMWKFYRVCDYFVNLNKGEIFGMAIMEAIYYQVSVAAHDAPGPRVTMKDMPGHRLCQSDGEIASWLAGAYPSREALASSAEKIKRDFCWDHCAKAFAEIVAGGVR